MNSPATISRARTMSAAEREEIADQVRAVATLRAEAALGEGRARTAAIGILLDAAIDSFEREDDVARMLGAIRDYVGISPTSDDPEHLAQRAGAIVNVAVRMSAELDERARWAAAKARWAAAKGA